MQELGFEPREGESVEETQSRAGVIEAMTMLAEDQSAIEESMKMADREAEDPAALDPNLAPLFVYVAARFGDRARMDRYVELFQRRRDEGASPQVLQRILDSFVAFRPPELVQRTLRLVDEQVIPQESIGAVLTSALRARHAQAQAWDYVREHCDALHAVVGDTWIGRLVETTGYLPASERDNIVSFSNAKLRGVTDQSFARALERLDQTTEFRARTTPELVAWFKKQ
jgi:hypothetical protein